MKSDLTVIYAIQGIKIESPEEISFPLEKVIRRYLYAVWDVAITEGRREYNGNKTPILLMKHGAIIQPFESLADAARFLKCNEDVVSKAVRGLRRTCRGYDVRYKNRVNEWIYKRKKR